MEKQNILEIRNLTKDYDGLVILKGISFNVHEGEFVTLLGPSGCGKSTTLNIIGGRERPNSGEVLFDGKDLSPIPSNKRQINTIFQNYALFPQYDVFDNIAYGLTIRKTKPEIIQNEVNRFLEIMGLNGLENKRIDELSGGQKQRVAIARALILKPRVLLLDEPMAALDAHLRKKMQNELKDLQEEIGITFILVTHDQEEALTLSDRVIVMNQGVIQQIGTPQEIYNEPENKWVAKFIGSSNIIEDGIFIKDNLVEIDKKQFECLDKGFGNDEHNIDIMIRPEDIKVSKTKGDISGVIENTIFKGVHYELVVKTEFRNYIIHTTEFFDFDENVFLSWGKEDIHVMWKEIDE